MKTCLYSLDPLDALIKSSADNQEFLIMSEETLDMLIRLDKIVNRPYKIYSENNLYSYKHIKIALNNSVPFGTIDYR